MSGDVDKAIKETLRVTAEVKITIDFVDPREAQKILKIAEERRRFFGKTL